MVLLLLICWTANWWAGCIQCNLDLIKSFPLFKHSELYSSRKVPIIHSLLHQRICGLSLIRPACVNWAQNVNNSSIFLFKICVYNLKKHRYNLPSIFKLWIKVLKSIGSSEALVLSVCGHRFERLVCCNLYYTGSFNMMWNNKEAKVLFKKTFFKQFCFQLSSSYYQ